MSAVPKIDRLDLRLAWRRAKLDRPDRCFVDHPRIVAWIEQDLNAWLAARSSQFAAGYQPSDAHVCLAPKPGGSARVAKVLEISDETAYAALVSAAYPGIHLALKETQGSSNIAYQLQPPGRVEWVRSRVSIWRQWRLKSLECLENGTTWVVFADVAGFCDNIDLRILGSDLRAVGAENDIVRVLLHCLRRWSYLHERGIPQGYSASDILAKLYLHQVDVSMARAGFRTLRYVDDFRIFCSSRRDARRALLLLTKLLHEKGLTLQSSKSVILPIERAREKIDGVAPLIESVQHRLRGDLLIAYGEAGPYGTVSELRVLAEAHPDSHPPQVFEEVFRERFSEAGGTPFDSTLFHYLLTRLGRTKSRVATRYCLEILRERPEETKYVLSYLSEVGISGDEEKEIIAFISSSDAIYDFQLYEIVRWFFDTQNLPLELLTQCRSWAFDLNRAQWLRAYAFLALGHAGDESDLHSLQTFYPAARSDAERAEIVAAIARMERSRRNAFYSGVVGDGPLVLRAIEIAKATDGRAEASG